MKIGFRLPENSKYFQFVKNVTPDFWIGRDLSCQNLQPQSFYYLPSANHLDIAKNLRSKKLELSQVKDHYLRLNQNVIKKHVTENANNIKYVVFNEIFDMNEQIRHFYNYDFFREGLTAVKEIGGQTVFNEHRLVTLFLFRQKQFLELVEPLIKEGIIDYIGLQVWDVGRPLEFNVLWLLIQLLKKIGAKVLISEFGIYEPDPKKQAFRCSAYLQFFKNAGVESVGYWWLKDGPHTTMPNARDPSKNPGLYTQDWEPKPILEVFAKYVGTTD